MREASLERKTKETDIQIGLNLDGTGIHKISTGVGFFDHMLEQVAVHARIDLVCRCRGDLHVDAHHTVEDVGIALGEAIARSLGDKRGVTRYATAFIPMDETLVMTSIDLSGRAFFVFDADLAKTAIGQFDAELCEEFFRSVAHNAHMTLHMREIYGSNLHHIIEAMFKSFAHAFRQAIALTQGDDVLSSKGAL